MSYARILAAALYVACVPVWAQGGAPGDDATSAAGLFGVRETGQRMSMSPSGSRVVYIAPGPGRISIAEVADLSTGTSKVVLKADGRPEKLDWCRFVNEERLVCQISRINNDAGFPIPFTRLFAIGIDGSNPKSLGQRGSAYDARMRQFDGHIIDWLPGDGSAVLMAREYVPEAGKMNTRITRSADGLGVDRVDVNSLVATAVEPADKNADSFLTDGQGVVRMRVHTPDRGGTGQLAGFTNISYRTPGSKDWQPFSICSGAPR